MCPVMAETIMLYHASGDPDDVVSIQYGTYQFCKERLAEWQRNEVGVTISASSTVKRKQTSSS